MLRPQTPPPIPAPTAAPPRMYAYLGGNRALTQLTSGAPFFVNTEDRGITTWIILGGRWETFVDDVLCKLAMPGMSFLDIGANMGYYTVKIGRMLGPEGKVFSFEPNPELFPFLQDNVYVNGLKKRAQLWQLALGADKGSAALTFDYRNMGGGSVADGPARTRSFAVEIDSLDNLIPTGTRIDLIKIDAEGYEPQIVKGGRRLLTENRAAPIVMEVSVAHWLATGDAPEQMLSELIGDDREVFQLCSDGAVRPMGNAAQFLEQISSKFISYCLIAPKESDVRQRLASLIVESQA